MRPLKEVLKLKQQSNRQTAACQQIEMQESKTREKILKKVRSALIEQTLNPFPKTDTEAEIFQVSDEDMEVIFANNFSAKNGRFFYSENQFDFIEDVIALCSSYQWKNCICVEDQLKQFLTSVDFPFKTEVENNSENGAIITTCECLIARTGEVVFSSKLNLLTDSKLPVIVVADFSNILIDMLEALHLMRLKYGSSLPSSVNIVSPSAENNLFVFLSENSEWFKKAN